MVSVRETILLFLFVMWVLGFICNVRHCWGTFSVKEHCSVTQWAAKLPLLQVQQSMTLCPESPECRFTAMTSSVDVWADVMNG